MTSHVQCLKSGNRYAKPDVCRSHGVAAALIVAGMLARSAQEKRLITESDLLKFVWIADPQISPDGSQVVFTRVVVNDKQGRLRDEPAGGAGRRRRTAAAADVGHARLEPAVVARRPPPRLRALDRARRPARSRRRFIVLSLDGGEARADHRSAARRLRAGLVARRHAHRVLAARRGPTIRADGRAPPRRSPTCA